MDPSFLSLFRSNQLNNQEERIVNGRKRVLVQGDDMAIKGDNGRAYSKKMMNAYDNDKLYQRDCEGQRLEMETESSADKLHHWTKWQLLDSVLPTGGFAHSYGLEAAIQTHLVARPEDLKMHIVHVLDNTGSLLLPFVHCANKSPTIGNWSKLDNWLEAMLTNEVSRKASTAQGSSLLRVAASVYVDIPALKQMRSLSLSTGNISFHHAPTFGLLCGLLGFDSGFSQRAFMFMTMRDVLSAATRLNLVGPLGASAMQHQIAPIAEEMVMKWMDRPIEDACQTVPLLDTVQGCHGHLFSRLFCS